MMEHPEHPEHPAPAPAPVVVEDTTDVLGIISIALAFSGLAAVGFIVGLIGVSKAKQKKRPVIISRIGWIVNLVMMLFVTFIIVAVFASIPFLQRNARNAQDESTKSAAYSTRAGLVSYHARFSYYPATLEELQSSRSMNLVDSKHLKYTPSPAGCTTACTGYTLVVTYENGTTETIQP